MEVASKRSFLSVLQVYFCAKPREDYQVIWGKFTEQLFPHGKRQGAARILRISVLFQVSVFTKGTLSVFCVRLQRQENVLNANNDISCIVPIYVLAQGWVKYGPWAKPSQPTDSIQSMGRQLPTHGIRLAGGWRLQLPRGARLPGEAVSAARGGQPELLLHNADGATSAVGPGGCPIPPGTCWAYPPLMLAPAQGCFCAGGGVR